MNIFSLLSLIFILLIQSKFLKNQPSSWNKFCCRTPIFSMKSLSRFIAEIFSILFKVILDPKFRKKSKNSKLELTGLHWVHPPVWGLIINLHLLLLVEVCFAFSMISAQGSQLFWQLFPDLVELFHKGYFDRKFPAHFDFGNFERWRSICRLNNC